MRGAIYIKSQLDNELANAPTQEEQLHVFHAKIQLLTWIYNLGNLRTQEEMDIKLRNIQEELIALEFMQTPENAIEYKKIQARMKIMQDIMS